MQTLGLVQDNCAFIHVPFRRHIFATVEVKHNAVWSCLYLYAIQMACLLVEQPRPACSSWQYSTHNVQMR